MKKRFAIFVVLSFLLNACLPAFPQTETDVIPTPISESDLQLTAAVLSQQTLQALPSDTSVPSETPVIVTATNTEIPATPTETPNPVLLTLAATLGTGTVTAEDVDGTPGAILVGTLPFTGTPSLVSPQNATATIEPKPLSYGTLPPNLPFGHIILINKAKADAYISLRCVTKDGYVTILEYPVKGTVKAKAPVGKYTYVAWVGGRQFTGSFSLSNDSDDLIITLFKDKITIK